VPRPRLRIEARLLRGIADQLGKEVSADELRTRALAGEQPYAQVYVCTLDAVAKLAQAAAMNFHPRTSDSPEGAHAPRA
jgi:hypothetical protein